jgi:pimeloyl-ACP methyl ester carboxylesterase
MRHTKIVRITATAIHLLLLTGVSSLLFSSSATAATTHGSCREVTVPVSLSSGAPKDQHIAGTFCTPNSWAPGTHQADIMVAGATYDRTYWDADLAGTTYSYVDKTLGAGRATFAIDRLGSGKSSFPLSLAVTNVSSAYAIHQTVQWVQNSQSISKVNLIGHSIGATLSIREAATYHDINKLVVTGTTHPFDPINTLPALLSARPAALDPMFASKGYELGYITSAAGTRAASFYAQPIDPAVIAYDEAHKAVLSLTELTTALTDVELPALLNPTSGVTAPVLVVAGEHDKLYCEGLLNPDCSSDQKVVDHERQFYSQAASVDARIIADTGHSLTLSPSHNVSFAAINDWIQQ